jgi:hypothetical protein
MPLAGERTVVRWMSLAYPHMRFFVNNEQVFDITHSLHPTDSVILVQALSGG